MRKLSNYNLHGSFLQIKYTVSVCKNTSEGKTVQKCHVATRGRDRQSLLLLNNTKTKMLYLVIGRVTRCSPVFSLIQSAKSATTSPMPVPRRSSLFRASSITGLLVQLMFSFKKKNAHAGKLPLKVCKIYVYFHG